MTSLTVFVVSGHLIFNFAVCFPGLGLPGENIVQKITKVDKILEKKIKGVDIEKPLETVRGQVSDLGRAFEGRRMEHETSNAYAEMNPNSYIGVKSRITKLMKYQGLKDCSWYKGFKEHGRSKLCYSVSEISIGRQDAMRYCQQESGSLLTLDNPDKIAAVKSVLRGVSDATTFYIGADNFLNKTEGFQWTDGSLVDNAISPWQSGYPSPLSIYTPIKPCVLMQYSSEEDSVKWRNVQCSEKHRFICEIL